MNLKCKHRSPIGDIEDYHEFIVDRNGELLESARQIPIVRRYIESLPKTAATFKPRQITGLEVRKMAEVQMEFAGSWRTHETQSTKEQRYVNPNYGYVRQYSDLSVECECGAIVTQHYALDSNPRDIEHDHADDCMPFDRMRARADLAEVRWNEINRLSRLGWKATEIAPRIGVSRSKTCKFATDYGTSVKELFNEFRRMAGNSYSILVENGVSSDEIESIYGYDRTTLYRWSQIEQ